MLTMTLKGRCTEDDFASESKRIEGEMRAISIGFSPRRFRAAIDPKMLIVGITRAFARFAKQPFAEKHALLRTVFRDFALDSGNVTGFTLNGGFLDSANSQARCSASWTPCFYARCRSPKRANSFASSITPPASACAASRHVRTGTSRSRGSPAASSNPFLVSGPSMATSPAAASPSASKHSP